MVCVGGRYQILGKLGAGGTSTVYLAVDNVLHKQWAIKETATDFDDDKKALILQSLRAEVEVLNHCNHPSIPRIVDFFEENGRAYAVRDYVDGFSLKSMILQEGVMSPAEVCNLGIRLCGLLQYLHSLNPSIVYCDLKPSNIMLGADSKVYLIDFGSALEIKNKDGVLVQPSRFKQDARFATRGFAAPELFKTESKIGIFTDVYSLGATLWFALTGKCFSDNKTIDSENSEHYDATKHFTNFDLADGGFANDFQAVLMRAMLENPLERYADCKEFAQSLEDCLENYLGDNLDSGVEGIENIRSRVNHYKNNRRDKRKSSRRSMRKNTHKKSGRNSYRNIVIKIICCILMVVVGCFLIGTSLHSLTSNSQISSRKNDYVQLTRDNDEKRNKNAIEKISDVEKYKNYMRTAAKSVDSKQVIQNVNQAMRLQIKLFNANIQPLSIQPILRLLVHQIEDFRWTLDEREDFTALINEYKNTLKKSEDWYELCLSVGKAYWYYSVENGEEVSDSNRKTRITAASEWFKEALKGVKSKDYELASMYYSIGSEYLSFASYAEGKSKPQNVDYITKLHNFIENAKKNQNEIVKIDACELVFNSLKSWISLFKSYAVSQDSIENIFDDALDLARSIKSQNKNVDNRVKQIMSQADPLIDSIENIFDNGGA